MTFLKQLLGKVKKCVCWRFHCITMWQRRNSISPATITYTLAKVSRPGVRNVRRNRVIQPICDNGLGTSWNTCDITVNGFLCPFTVYMLQIFQQTQWILINVTENLLAGYTCNNNWYFHMLYGAFQYIHFIWTTENPDIHHVPTRCNHKTHGFCSSYKYI